MAELTKLIEVISALIWPAIVAWALWSLLPALSRIIESRAFTLKFAGFEISAQDAVDQMKDQLQDLQVEVAALRGQLDARGAGLADEPAGIAAGGAADRDDRGVDAGARRGAVGQGRGRILWVDDHPENNALEIAQFEDLGYRVTLAGTTQDAMAQLAGGARGGFDLVISDMGRQENGRYVRDAGLELLRQMRAGDHAQPFLIYASQEAAARGAAAVTHYADAGITASPNRVLGWVMSDGRG